MLEKKLFPVSVVGSWPRPDWLIRALRRKQSGEITDREFQEVADRAVLDALRLQEEAGVDIPTDGEQRRDNLYSFVVEKLGGMRLMKVSELIDYMKDRAMRKSCGRSTRIRYQEPDRHRAAAREKRPLAR